MSKDGEFTFDSTGDELLDKWEEEYAKGIIPDLEEGLSPQEKEKLRRERAKHQPREPAGVPSQEASKYDSKFVARGSQEEQALLQSRMQHKILGHGKSIPSLADAVDDLLGGGDDWQDLIGA